MRYPVSFVLFALACGGRARGASPAAAPPSRPILRFEAQDDRRILWKIRGAAYQAEFASDSFQLRKPANDILNVRLMGASRNAPMVGEEPLASHSYYFHGHDPNHWRSNVGHFTKLRAEGIYPGIDALYYWGKNGLETDFEVSPGADDTRLTLAFDQRRIALDNRGNLRDQSSGELLMAAPQAYEIDGEGRRNSVASRFRLSGKNQAHIETARLHRSRKLVIDPTLSFATYLGGSGRDTLVEIERGVDGRIYVAGHTTSVDIPQAVALNSILERPISLPLEDTFVACYSSDGATLQYVVYVGGDLQDIVTSLAVDGQGRATVAGYSYSKNFPTTPGSMAPTLGSRPFDAFTYRLASDGSALEYSTFLGVISPIYGYLAANNIPLTFLVGVDASGAATVAGHAEAFLANGVTLESVSGITPTPGAFQSKPPGGNDIFLLRLTPNGNAVQWATYYGGSQDEMLNGLAMDSAGNILVVGTTKSNDLPLARPFQPAPPTIYSAAPFYNSATAGFFAKFSSDGKALMAASYFGGQSNQSALTSVAIDNLGMIYLAGASPAAAAPVLTDLPATPTQIVYGSGPSTLVKLDPTGASVQYAWAYSFLGSGPAQRVRVDASQRPSISIGLVNSIAFPGALPDNGYPGGGFACFAADGKTVQLETTVPFGSITARLVDFTVDPTGVLIGAMNGSGSFPTTPNAPQPVPPGGSQTGFVFILQPNNPAPQLFYVDPPVVYAPVGNTSLSLRLSLIGANLVQGSTILWNGSPLSLPASPFPLTSNLMVVSGSVIASTLTKGDVQIQLSTPGPGGGVSAPFTIKYVNPSPGNAIITPSVVPTGAAATTFTITGSLTSDCTATWNGAPQALTPAPAGLSGFQFTKDASAFSSAGDNVVVISNPLPGGGSVVVHVTVTASGLPNSTTTITNAVVVGVGQGGSPQTLTVSSALPGAVVVWNGSDRPTTAVNNTTLQFVLAQTDVSKMGTAQVQVRSGGSLGPAVTAYIAMPGGSFVRGDAARGQVYFARNNSSNQLQVLVAGAVPSGQILRSIDLGAKISTFFPTDDNQYLWVVTADGRVSRVNIDSFAVDLKVVVPVSSNNSSVSAVPVSGTSSTIVAAGADGVLRIFDGDTQRGFSSADLFPAVTQTLTPIFATLDVVWATVGYNTGCLARLTYDFTGFSSFTQTCGNGPTGPWGLLSPEVKVESGVTYFQSGSEAVIWTSPFPGSLIDFTGRRILQLVNRSGGVNSNIFYSLLYVYGLDTEALLSVVPPAGGFPAGTLAAYSSSQVVIGNTAAIVLVDLPQ
jgi:hypothetical protein